jgi:hypothetical protein
VDLINLSGIKRTFHSSAVLVIRIRMAKIYGEALLQTLLACDQFSSTNCRQHYNFTWNSWYFYMCSFCLIKSSLQSLQSQFWSKYNKNHLVTISFPKQPWKMLTETYGGYCLTNCSHQVFFMFHSSKDYRYVQATVK